jgi:uncharacterized protein YodC (DUF2158 family)
MDFKPGDTVKLKSGGKLMTIESIEDGFAKCVWFKEDENKQAMFGLETLEPAKRGGVASARGFSF